MAATRDRGWLAAIERAGNRLPEPLTFFVLFAFAVVVASALAAHVGLSAVHPATKQTVAAVNLLSTEGVRRMLAEAVKNFGAFPPLATVLAVMIGTGIAEGSGLVSAALRQLLFVVPPWAVTAALVFAGVNGSLASDASIVILPPLGAMLFLGLGRHPLAGLIASFASVSGGYGAGVLITALDPLYAGITEAAARVIAPGYGVLPTSNWFFKIASTAILTAIGTVITTRVIEPRLGPYTGGADAPAPEPLTALEKRGLLAAGLAVAALLILVVVEATRDGGVLRGTPPDTAKPLFDGIVALLLITFGGAGLAYGVAARTIKTDRDVAKMTGDSLASMGGYIVLAFVAAQFIAYFAWSNLGLIVAVKGAGALKGAGFTGLPLLVGFVVLSLGICVLITSATASWSIMAPVFVPMLMLVGWSPEAILAAWRISDSAANIATPLLPYFPLLVAYARRYDPKAGMGTLMALLLPYAACFWLAWTLLLTTFVALDLPLGPTAPLRWAP